jgi:predicted transport protein
VRKMFFALQESINSLPSAEEIVVQKTGVTYRTTKSFTRIEFGRTYLRVLVREAKYKDPKRLVRDITSHAWGYKGLIKLESPENVDAAFAIVQQSYEQTL